MLRSSIQTSEHPSKPPNPKTTLIKSIIRPAAIAANKHNHSSTSSTANFITFHIHLKIKKKIIISKNFSDSNHHINPTFRTIKLKFPYRIFLIFLTTIRHLEQLQSRSYCRHQQNDKRHSSPAARPAARPAASPAQTQIHHQPSGDRCPNTCCQPISTLIATQHPVPRPDKAHIW